MALSILSNANLMSLADLCSLDSRLGIWSGPIFFWTDSSQILAIQGSIRHSFFPPAIDCVVLFLMI
jgi:hypothetical protein